MARVTDCVKDVRSRAFWIALIILLVFVELVARITYPWFLRHAPEGYLSSAPYVRDLLNVAHDSNAAILMGDSILGSSALREHRVDNAGRFQLSTILREDLSSQNRPVITVAADGMLPADMVGALTLAPKMIGGPLVVVLNVRMFSPEFQVAEKEFFFPFLKKESPRDDKLA